MNQQGTQGTKPKWKCNGGAIWENISPKTGEPYLSMKLVGHEKINFFLNQTTTNTTNQQGNGGGSASRSDNPPSYPQQNGGGVY